MNFLSAVFGNSKKAMIIRYSKSSQAWQVCNAGRVVYLGTKSSCEDYMRFMSGNSQ